MFSFCSIVEFFLSLVCGGGAGDPAVSEGNLSAWTWAHLRRDKVKRAFETLKKEVTSKQLQAWRGGILPIVWSIHVLFLMRGDSGLLGQGGPASHWMQRPAISKQILRSIWREKPNQLTGGQKNHTLDLFNVPFSGGWWTTALSDNRKSGCQHQAAPSEYFGSRSCRRLVCSMKGFALRTDLHSGKGNPAKSFANFLERHLTLNFKQ